MDVKNTTLSSLLPLLTSEIEVPPHTYQETAMNVHVLQAKRRERGGSEL